MEDEQLRQAGVESNEQESQVEKQTARNPTEESSEESSDESMDEIESASLAEENEIESAGREGMMSPWPMPPPPWPMPPPLTCSAQAPLEMREAWNDQNPRRQVWGLCSGVKKHAKDKDFKLLTAAHSFMKGASNNETEDDAFYKQKIPMGNNLLHIGVQYGKDTRVGEVARRHPDLVTAKNWERDTPLHVAAKAGYLTTLGTLLDASLGNLPPPPPYSTTVLSDILAKNKSGNSFFHEALSNGHEGAMLVFSHEAEDMTNKKVLELAALFQTNKENKSGLYLTIEAGNEQAVQRALAILIEPNPDLDELIEKNPELAQLIPRKPNHVLPGKSPMLAAIARKELGLLRIIIEQKPDWIHMKDREGRTPLHYAASIGYLPGVRYLLTKCPTCTLEPDKTGFFPLHLASHGGHIEVVKELVKRCPNATEIVDKKGRNIFHIAAQSGNLNVVRYILEHPELKKMVNAKDVDGNTALHLATLLCHPRVVHTLTWNERVVELNSVNKENQTALDLFIQCHAAKENPTLKQRLIWIALKSAGVQRAGLPRDYIKVPDQYREPPENKSAAYNGTNQFKDIINTLILVSTLITTVTFAAGLTIPGGNNDSNQGIARMLNRTLFQLFIFCITVSLYGSISVTVILILAQLGDPTLMLLSLHMAKPLLGITLTTLSLAFMAGVYLVVSKLTWLAITFLVTSSILILVLILFYMLLWLPSSSNFPVVRYMSYYPFLLLAWRADAKKY